MNLIMRKKYKFISLLLIFAFFISCTPEMRQTFGDMFDLRASLEEKFGAGAPNINTGGNSLSINYINSAFNDLPPEERQMKAREIAVFTAENYKDINEIENISVNFTVHKEYIVFRYTNGLDAYQFSTKELLPEKKIK